MEFLQQLLSALLNNEQTEKLAPLLKYLSDNSFDFKKILHNLKPETLAPLFKAFSDMQNKSRTQSVRQNYGTAPISKIADKDIIYVLNRHLGDCCV